MKIIARFLLLIAFLGRAQAEDFKMFPITSEDKSFFEEVKRAVLAGNTEVFSKMVNYPLAIRLSDKTIKLKNAKDVRKNAAIIFTVGVKSAVSNQSPESLFKNWQGVMIGKGEIWFSQVKEKTSADERWVYRIIGMNPNDDSAYTLADSPTYESYSVQSNPTKRFAKTKIPESGIDWKMREHLRFSDDNPLNFAGQYTLFEIGCGTGCVEFCLIDRTTGEVHTGMDFNQDFPKGYVGLTGLQYRKSSRLLEVYHATASKYPVTVDSYLWDGTKFNLLRSAQLNPNDAQ
jgi:hypothetical protein